LATSSFAVQDLAGWLEEKFAERPSLVLCLQAHETQTTRLQWCRLSRRLPLQS